jgi:hypothetical protein
MICVVLPIAFGFYILVPIAIGKLTKRGLPERALKPALFPDSYRDGRQQKSSPDKSEELSIL